MEKTQRKRKIRVRWTPDAEKMLVQYWADNINDLRGAKKNLHIFTHIEGEFARRQMFYSSGEIKEKIHNFTNRYKLEKKQMGSTGGSPSTWVHYKEVEEILSGNKAVNFDILMQDSIDVGDDDNINPFTSSQSASNTSIDELAGSPSTPVSAKRKKATYESFIENMERTSNMLKEEMSSLKEIQNKAVLAEEKRNEILEEMSNNTKNFYKDLINLLRE